jgi:hypothetical protein
LRWFPGFATALNAGTGLAKCRVVMNTQTESHAAMRHDERGVIYVEQLLMVLLGICIAAALTIAARQRLLPRFERMSDVLDSNVP